MREMLSTSGLSLLSSDSFEWLLRRASLNLRLGRSGTHFSAPPGSHTPTRIDSDPIGATAGALWQILSDDGSATFAGLIQEVGVPESLFYMAVGWLVREGKLEFEKHDGDYLIRLK
jgi:winged helix-turn-helix protein DUF2582